MIEKINEELNKQVYEDKTIYVLKGFNSIINHLSIEIPHIINLEIDKDFNNILKINKQEVMMDIISLLYSKKHTLNFVENINVFSSYNDFFY